MASDCNAICAIRRSAVLFYHLRLDDVELASGVGIGIRGRLLILYAVAIRTTPSFLFVGIAKPERGISCWYLKTSNIDACPSEGVEPAQDAQPSSNQDDHLDRFAACGPD